MSASTPTPNVGGRPPLPAGTGRSRRLVIRLTPDEAATIEEAAIRAHDTTGGYVRRTVLDVISATWPPRKEGART